jgi:hypothetical protein
MIMGVNAKSQPYFRTKRRNGNLFEMKIHAALFSGKGLFTIFNTINYTFERSYFE